jgi:hypothetical protein
MHVQLHQSNPVFDFYCVEADTPAGHQKGWVPAPFLEFDPPSPELNTPVDRTLDWKSVTAITDTIA